MSAPVKVSKKAMRSRVLAATSRKALASLAGVCVASLAISACGASNAPITAGSPSGPKAAGSGPLTVAVFDAFEGADAATGTTTEAECYAAVTVFNANGGLLGHKVQCTPFDSTSDPADAVPVANRMLASTHNLILVDGPGSEEPAVEPLLNKAQVIHYAWNGLPFYDHQTSPYFYRAFPSDSLGGEADALYLINAGYKQAAGVFDNSGGAQAQVPNFVHTYARLGGHLAALLKLAPNSTYQTEAQQLSAAKPDAIISEIDTPQEVEAWDSALANAANGAYLPLITTAGEVDAIPNWIQLVSHALGASGLKNVVQLAPGGALNPAGYPTLRHALLTAPQSIVNRKQYLGLGYIATGFDAVILDGLAIDEAKSTDPAKVAPLIAQIANGTPGAVTVNTYPQGAKAIAQGHKVHYVGAGGAMLFNRWHNLVESFQALRYDGPKAGWVAMPGKTITQQEIAKLGG
jgi:ABC-type branched-subunit amino acid transport system substrate-binding protein